MNIRQKLATQGAKKVEQVLEEAVLDADTGLETYAHVLGDITAGEDHAHHALLRRAEQQAGHATAYDEGALSMTVGNVEAIPLTDPGLGLKQRISDAVQKAASRIPGNYTHSP